MNLSALLYAILTDEGYEVEQAYSLSDAFHLIDEHAFDGAVLDVELGDGVVFSMADVLKARGIPHFFLSAVYRGVVPAAHGATRFVSKPYSLDEIRREVGDMLERPQ